jgi:hypothetical protein
MGMEDYLIEEIKRASCTILGVIQVNTFAQTKLVVDNIHELSEDFTSI